MNSRQLSLAPNKFQHLPVQCNNSNCKIPLNTYSINSVSIASNVIVKDLGVFISCNLKWNNHISFIHSKASACSYQLLKSFATKTIWTLLTAYNSFVRPLLEYKTPVWSPYLLKDIKSIESVQKKFTKNICKRCGIPFSNYIDRLNKLSIKSLQYRRIEFDLILTYKICNNLSDIPLKIDSTVVILDITEDAIILL